MTEANKIVVEEVEAVDAPPKARVEEAPRQRDYLDGFLAAKPAEAPAGEPGGAV